MPESLKTLLLLYSTLMAINVLVSGYLWIRTRFALYRMLLVYWFWAIAFFILQGATADVGQRYHRLLLFAASLAFTLAQAKLVSALAGLRFSFKPYLLAMLAAFPLTLLLREIGAPLLLYSLPIPCVSASPILVAGWLTFRKHRKSSSPALVLLGVVSVLVGLHVFDFALVYHHLPAEIPGFFIATALTAAFSIVAPSAIVEALTSENERLKARGEFETRMIHSAKMAALGEMASGVAHEINNPLMIVTSTADVLAARAKGGNLDPGQLATGMKRISDTAFRIAQIVLGLRTFARASEGDPLTNESLRPLVEGAVALCTESLKSLRIRFEVGTIPDVEIRCRPAEIAQVLLNLIHNARDAVEGLEERWIRLDFRRTADQLVIELTDSGNGIPASISEKIMQPFFTTKPPGRGTGLGLSIASGLAQGMGGNLRYEPGSPHTRFILELKVA